jgi:hypothetical protein
MWNHTKCSPVALFKVAERHVSYLFPRVSRTPLNIKLCTVLLCYVIVAVYEERETSEESKITSEESKRTSEESKITSEESKITSEESKRTSSHFYVN